MSDSVIGVAVLDRTRTNAPLSDFLHMLCRYRDGSDRHEGLPVRPKGSPPIAESTTWEYEIKGDVLHVAPSVRISTTRPSKANPAVNEPVELFHNEGAWSIPFQEFAKREESDPLYYVQAYDLFRAVNGLQKNA